MKSISAAACPSAIGVTGLAAHIPDGLGRRLCHTQIKRGQWLIHYQSPEKMVICSNCRRAGTGGACKRSRRGSVARFLLTYKAAT
jgi:hypothetical protein